ncbi:helix-turn-helix domain-containing protein [Legionella feeleii]|uniref:Peptidase, S24 family n=1 Tax=Legionella feeleii TaxID=453 RepID=A0A0W0TH27_9GAMM|nr:helix-turn-helix domain-containing protein [Legionella feeleii]KTC94848.1 peptidase, S24 family [Legionella feeleii]SPX62069.1 peptidase, S24 family [Legionella feeleii]
MHSEYRTNSSPSEKLGKILNQLMKQYEIDGVQLSHYTGIPTTTINRLRQGIPNGNPTLLTLIPIAQHFSITVSQLIGESCLTPEPAMSSLPLISWDEAINPSKVKNISQLSVLSENSYSKDAFALIVEGDNYQDFSRGTLLLIDPQLTPQDGNIVLISSKMQRTPILKKLLVENSVYFLKSMIYEKHIEKFDENDYIIGVLAEYKRYLLKR